VTLPQHGTLTLSGVPVTIGQEIPTSSIGFGEFVYVSSFGFSGNDEWKWNGFDSQLYSSNDATVKIQIFPVTKPTNHPPIISDISLQVNLDGILSFSESTFVAAFSDIDLDPFIMLKVVTSPEHGVLKWNDLVLTADSEIFSTSIDQLSYVPVKGYAGNDQWKWNAFDSQAYSLSDAAVKIQIGTVTGITSKNEGSLIELFPNPFISVLHISVTSAMGDELSISIMDVLGVEVKRVQSNKVGFSFIAEPDLSDFPSGMYYVKVRTGNSEAVRKVVKQ
jgi:hypothetical protein